MHWCTDALMHWCIHAYMHTCIHAYMHTCTHAHMHTCTHAHMHTCTHAHMHTCTHTHMHTCTHAVMHTCTHAHMRTFIHPSIHPYTHTIHTYIHTYQTYRHTHKHTCTHADMQTCRHAHMHTCTYPSIHTYTHTHSHIHICSWFFIFFLIFSGQMAVDRKSLCILAETEPASFKCIVDEAKRQVENYPEFLMVAYTTALNDWIQRWLGLTNMDERTDTWSQQSEIAATSATRVRDHGDFTMVGPLPVSSGLNFNSSWQDDEARDFGIGGAPKLAKRVWERFS